MCPECILHHELAMGLYVSEVKCYDLKVMSSVKLAKVDVWLHIYRID